MKQMYCDYRKHTYKVGDLIYLDRTCDGDLLDHGEYGKIIDFTELDNCKMVTYEVIMDNNGDELFFSNRSTVCLRNIQPAKEVIECKINELQHKIDFFGGLLENE